MDLDTAQSPSSAGSPEEETVYARCHSSIAASAGLNEFLAVMPDGQRRLPRQVPCVLQYGHLEEHVGLLQGSGERRPGAWWLRWDDTAGLRSLVQSPYCRDGRSAPDACLLPGGHEGHHSGQLSTLLDVPPELRLLAPAPSRTR
ncbi:hypothetical protein [Catellatospora sp. NPDC049609]|uniref:hypothetical protein n=1 Tax=Catellatospora sp. NPDC049609 TaxID=3155505 RepID=UPI0034252890